ncbi:MAG: tyrosine-type recombinase/integrase [Eubacteriales bacterium]|nr:tyrosine-type recombinase/integrase [Eubacteriales bacterium]
MEKQPVTINELISRMMSELRRMGYSESTLWNQDFRRVGGVRKYYRDTGRIYYDPAVTEEYLQIQKKRYEDGEITLNTYQTKLRIAKKLNVFFLTGEVRVYEKKGTRYFLSPANERILDEFLASKNYGRNTRDDVVWIVRRYLSYWEQLGHGSLETVGVEDVREFILKTASEVKVSSLHNILLYLRHFHEYLKEFNIPAPDCIELFTYKVYRDMPIQSYVTDEELRRILAVIDTDTEIGKRNKAIILLAASTGLRAVDLIRMKLTDIDWKKGEIKVYQSKTGNTIHVPILRETGEALQDYILNARSTTSGCSEVFLRGASPKTALQDASSIGDMFKSYQKKAGIERQPFDGKGFHGLRRRLAKKLIVNGSSLMTIAQILGHENIKSARQYLSLNTDNLKECALGFQGISIKREELL